jgi:hypothetical protein
MATTLQIPSFDDINIVERTQLDDGIATLGQTLIVQSTAGFGNDGPVFVGTPGLEGCEPAVVEDVSDSTTLNLIDGLTLSHARFEPVTAVVGAKIRIYRAPVELDGNGDAAYPDDSDFTVLATRTIDADQQTTYYTDPDGSGSYWYKFTYYDEASESETDIGAIEAVRGDDFGHYASISEIRVKAGFQNAYNLNDTKVDQCRRIAEAEINASLANTYTTPFTRPVPAEINALTIQLAAGLLLLDAYGEDSTKGKTMVKDARDQLKAMQERTSTITGDDGLSIASDTSVHSYPDTQEEDGGPSRAFDMDMVL